MFDLRSKVTMITGGAGLLGVEHGEAIASVARRYGAEVPFLRPAKLAQDHVSLIPVAQHAMEFFDRRGWPADVVVSIHGAKVSWEDAVASALAGVR